MKVYHGSYLEVRTINLSLGRSNRDFGRGFYITKFQKLAQEWADRKGEDNHTKGIVSEFIFDEFIWEDTELKFHKPTHQICFCTTASLQALEYIDSRAEWNIEHIANDIIKRMIVNKNIDEMKATDIFFTSKTFSSLSDKSTGLYLKPGQEIYEILKKELKM